MEGASLFKILGFLYSPRKEQPFSEIFTHKHLISLHAACEKQRLAKESEDIAANRTACRKDTRNPHGSKNRLVLPPIDASPVPKYALDHGYAKTAEGYVKMS